MNIIQINTGLAGGGAEKICLLLHQNYLSAGLSSFVAIRDQDESWQNVIPLLPNAMITPWQKSVAFLLDPFCNKVSALPLFGYVFSRFRNLLKFLPRHAAVFLGRENFYYPASRKILEYSKKHFLQKPDILHAHNLHGDYFDLSALPYYSRKIPFLITLHDNWLLTGHCAYFFECNRWKTGCGKCPDLNIYPAIKRDATAFNWRRKRKIYAKSLLYIAAPSQWMIDCLRASPFASFVRKMRVIPNGVSNSIFRPQDKKVLRGDLNLPEDAYIFLFVAQGYKNNPFKDYDTIAQAILIISQKSKRKIVFMGIGASSSQEDVKENMQKRQEKVGIRHVSYIKDEKTLAKYYACADVYLHAAKAENMPLTILEALSCATPVVATKVGGIPEIIQDGENGFLVPKGDAKAMAERALEIISNKEKYQSFSQKARETAVEKYSLDRMVQSYLEYYDEIIDDFHSYKKSGAPAMLSK